MNKRKPVVGEKLYRVDTGNLARNGKGKQVHVFVKKVGRKYFKVNESMDGSEWADVEFCIETWGQNTHYSSDYLLFESEQEYLEKKESDYLFHKIKNQHFSSWANPYSLDKLRQIKAIIES